MNKINTSNFVRGENFRPFVQSRIRILPRGIFWLAGGAAPNPPRPYRPRGRGRGWGGAAPPAADAEKQNRSRQIEVRTTASYFCFDSNDSENGRISQIKDTKIDDFLIFFLRRICRFKRRIEGERMR